MMPTNLNRFHVRPRPGINDLVPQPGEIWELRSDLTQQQPRRVMVVHEPEEWTGQPTDCTAMDNDCCILSIMVLSTETTYLSTVDVLVAESLSGLGEVLAETWHVRWIWANHLSHPVGRRLPRSVYDYLLDIGDRPPSLLSLASTSPMGVTCGTQLPTHPDIQAFHHREEDWSQSLSLDPTTVSTYRASGYTYRILQAALPLERDLLQIMEGCVRLIPSCMDTGAGYPPSLTALVRGQTSLNSEARWTAMESLDQPDSKHLAGGVRWVRVMDCEMQGAGLVVVLAIARIEKSDHQVDILLHVYPASSDLYLPPNLRLLLLDKTGQILRDVMAHSTDFTDDSADIDFTDIDIQLIQLQFSGQPDEPLSVRICLGDDCFTKDFRI